MKELRNSCNFFFSNECFNENYTHLSVYLSTRLFWFSKAAVPSSSVFNQSNERDARENSTENELETGNAVSWVVQLRHVANVSNRVYRRVQSAPMIGRLLSAECTQGAAISREIWKREQIWEMAFFDNRPIDKQY